jgi:hypothetical protein
MLIETPLSPKPNSADHSSEAGANPLKSSAYPAWESTIFPNAVTNTDTLLKMVYGHFGFEQTLLFAFQGQKLVPSRCGSNITLAKSHESFYQLELTGADIAVQCGPQSKNLAAIRFYDEQAREEFLGNNPLLRFTLKTSSPNGFLVWMRIEGNVPVNYQHSTCGWFSNGKVIVAAREFGSLNKFDDDFVPVTIKFEDIIWSPELAERFNFNLAAFDYPVGKRDQRGRTIVNDDYVVALFKRQNAIFFDPVTDGFYSNFAGQVKVVYPEIIKGKLHSLLELLRKTVSTEQIFVDTSPLHLKRLVEALKVAAVKPLEDAAAAFETFIDTKLEPIPGADMTVAEAYLAYADFCAAKSCPRFSESQFQDRIAGMIKRRYGIDKNHRTIRQGGAKRGFFNLRVKSTIDLGRGTYGTLGTPEKLINREPTDNTHRLFGRRNGNIS